MTEPKEPTNNQEQSIVLLPCPCCGSNPVRRPHMVVYDDWGMQTKWCQAFPAASEIWNKRINQTTNNLPPDVEQVYQEFWKPLVERDGVVDMQQVKKELFDFWQAMDRVTCWYQHVTGGQVSKMLTDAEVVKSLADDHYDAQVQCCDGCPGRERQYEQQHTPQGPT